MTALRAYASPLWIITLVAACGFVVTLAHTRAQRVQYVTAVALESQRVDPESPTGRAGGTRELILPARDFHSAHWVVQTQQMLAQEMARVRHVHYENAPAGRPVSAASAYRWWLALVAGVDHLMTGDPLAIGVERAALWADPLLQLLIIVVTSVYVLRQFGVFAASLTSIGLATLFPLSASFLPGAPDHHGLIIAATLWGVLPLLAGLHVLYPPGGFSGETDTVPIRRRARACFITAGIGGGLGMWISVSPAVAILAGIIAGAWLATWMARRTRVEDRAPPLSSAPWWSWSIAGAVTILLTFLIEYAPAHLGTWNLRVNHPLYALAWLGGGALIIAGSTWINKTDTRPRRIALLAAGGTLGLAAVPITMWLAGDPGFLAPDISAYALTRFSEEGRAAGLFAWLARDGFSRLFFIVALPAVVLIASALWMIRQRDNARSSPVAIAVGLGPIGVLLVVAGWRMNTWSILDAALLALLVVITVSVPVRFPTRGARSMWAAGAALVFGLGAIQGVQTVAGDTRRPLEASEFASLVQRDLAHWLSKRTQGSEPVILAPPAEALALAYYAGLPGLGTLNWENGDGIRAITRVLRATSTEEAAALFDARGITHVILPSWDPYFEQLVGVQSAGAELTFFEALKELSLPPWLRPVPYTLPADAQTLGQSVIVLERVEEQSETLALTRLTDYFIEMGQLKFAAAVSISLRSFPADLDAWVARTQVEMAATQQPASVSPLGTVLALLERGGDRSLEWDRRVALAVVLARGQRMDLAKTQVRHCLAAVSADQIRGLSAAALYRLLYLARTFDLPIADEELRTLALDLLPAEARTRLTAPQR